MNLLAFVTFTILAPAEMAGQVWVMPDPQECGPTLEMIIAEFYEVGVMAMGQCEYTSAPATSIRPEARGEK